MNSLYEAAAPFYDADYAALHYTADIDFYVALAREHGGPVLEIGCGTGRVLLPTAKAGIPIHGLDPSPAMLQQLRAKLAAEPPGVQQRIGLTEGDGRSASLGMQFPLITAPFRVLQMIPDRDGQRAFLRNVRRHMAPGGVFGFDVFLPDLRYLAGPRAAEIDVDRTDPATGRRVRRYGSVVPHNAWQTMDVRFEWVISEPGGREVERRSAEIVVRWFTRAELENLLELEGFRITGYWGSFLREPFGETSTEQVIRAVAMA